MRSQTKLIRYALTESPLGMLFIASTDIGICMITWAEEPQETLAELALQYPLADFVRDDASLQEEINQLRAYLTGESTSFDLPLDLHVTDFQAGVLGVLNSIPYGETRTYAQVAQALGNPKASRAVGNACARNPVPIIIPCHRVLHTSGNKMGYGGGIDRKQFLLTLEREHHLEAIV